MYDLTASYLIKNSSYDSRFHIVTCNAQSFVILNLAIKIGRSRNARVVFSLNCVCSQWKPVFEYFEPRFVILALAERPVSFKSFSV